MHGFRSRGEKLAVVARPRFQYNPAQLPWSMDILESPHKGKTGLRRIWNALLYSLDGLKAAYAHEDAFRQEVLLALVLAPLALLLPLGRSDKAMMIASLILVLIVELLNSAVEAAVDRVSLEDHRLAKRAKDIGSAAVLLSLVNAVVVWALVLLG